MEQGITQTSSLVDSHGNIPADFLETVIANIEFKEGCSLEDSNVILTPLEDGSYHRIAESIKE